MPDRPDPLNGTLPRPAAHGWYARGYDGRVREVWVFGGRPHGTVWVAVDADGEVMLTGSGGDPSAFIKPTRAEAIGGVIEAADHELSRARAAVDSLRAELAAADPV
jgi:hypothetical protein